MNEFQLSKEQSDALERLKEFIESDKDVIVLSGYAGTGKTSIMKEYIEFLDNKYYNYQLCAPTHKAKLVLQKVTNCDTITLHSLLKLSPKLDILRLDLSDLQFFSSGEGDIPYKGIVIVDEASMINDDLYDLLLEKCKQNKSKVLFVGDIGQIQPVNNGGLSKVFKNENIITLTQIFRQTEVNKLSDLLTTLRSNVVERFESSEDGSINTYNNTSQFVYKVLEDIKKTIELKDLNYSKLICYTNKRIDAYNQAIRKLLYNDNSFYHIGELLVGCENFSIPSGDFYNSSDYIITEINEYESYIPHIGKAFGYGLMLSDGEKEQTVFVIDPYRNDLNYIGLMIESIRMEAVSLPKGRKRALKWKEYYEIINSFATPVNITFDNRIVKSRTFNYGYAISAHKSQGSSYNKVYVDMKNLLLDRDPLELRQLQYVALSRTRTNVNLLV